MEQDRIIKLIFAFKVKYYRTIKNASYQELSEKSGISLSYLHDIEKAKKYPTPSKINALASALGMPYDELVSTTVDKRLQPIVDLIASDFFQIFPMEMFGLTPSALFDLFTEMPDKINAFISTLFKIARTYSVSKENFYVAALRSYQDFYDNYFGELEIAATNFMKSLDKEEISSKVLKQFLYDNYGVSSDMDQINAFVELKGLRSYYSVKYNKLYINNELSEERIMFLLLREIAFQYLQIKTRPYFTTILETDNFEKILNNFKSSYFASACLMPEKNMISDIRKVTTQSRWSSDLFFEMLKRYKVTPEMLMQRITNIVSGHFGINNLFFIRLHHDTERKHYRMSKEIHLSRLHSPYSSEMDEHYCRRWLSVGLVEELKQKGADHDILIDAQISQYNDTPNSYFCITVAYKEQRNPVFDYTSITIGFYMDNHLRAHFKMVDDPKVQQKIVHTTCERCNIMDCTERVVPPTIIFNKEKNDTLLKAVSKLS